MKQEKNAAPGGANGAVQVLDDMPVPAGTTVAAWERLGAKRVGNGWRWPERRADGEIVGWCTRFDAPPPKMPKVMADKGAKRGLILPWPTHPYAGTSPQDPILLTEGPSDTATALSFSFDVVIPSCTTIAAGTPRLLTCHRCRLDSSSEDRPS